MPPVHGETDIQGRIQEAWLRSGSILNKLQVVPIFKVVTWGLVSNELADKKGHLVQKEIVLTVYSRRAVRHSPHEGAY